MTMVTSFRRHWPEYLSEAAGLGLFMVSACAFTVLLEHPASGVHRFFESAFARRVLMGIAMGATSLAIVTSPLGQRSGAHLNPAMTLNYFLLGKIRPTDALWYVTAQFAGGALGVALAGQVIGPPIGHSAVRYAATLPGLFGTAAAFVAEFVISLILMLTVLAASNHWRFTRWTPWLASVLIALWITFEAPLSGMSMNPARTAGSAIGARVWTDWWIYFVAPPLGMVAAGALYSSRARVFCAKLHHHNDKRCIFRCNYGDL
jgi:aquaporin Z